MSAPALRLARLRAGYATRDGQRRVLEGVDLSLSPGEMVALLGPNGSGKTTLLRVIAGTVKRSAGTVELFGRSVDEWSRVDLARSVALVPQSLQLPAGFRVSEVVAMGRTPHGRSWFSWEAKDRRAVADALRDADAESLADRPATELSGGEQQRVLVALALAQEPKLLLMDEPTTHLDVAHAPALLAQLSALGRRRAVTVVVVLHDLVLAGMWAPRAVVLEGGRVAADGAPQDVLRPELVRRAYGVAVEEVITERGQRIVVPRLPAAAAGRASALRR